MLLDVSFPETEGNPFDRREFSGSTASMAVVVNLGIPEFASEIRPSRDGSRLQRKFHGSRSWSSMRPTGVHFVTALDDSLLFCSIVERIVFRAEYTE